MLPRSEVRPESERIDFLRRRDGYEMTRNWVVRTVNLYRAALGQHDHYAADPAYRPLFEKAVEEFDQWLASARDIEG